MILKPGRLIVVALTCTMALAGVACTNSKPLFVAPANESQLQQRIDQLNAKYSPYLRSLPKKVDTREQTSLNGDWKFVFEIKDPPRKMKAVPPAPKWYTADFDDAKWQKTTVPEWRYRMRGHDSAVNPDQVSQWKKYRKVKAASSICWYRRTFTTDKPTAGKRTWLCFDGVHWEAQVYLNGQRLGAHRVYYQPFRFDVTDKLKAGKNTLAVRVINGRQFGEPTTYWSIFPDIRAEEQRYTPDRAQSIKGNRPIGYHAGTGFGIWRDVYLQSTGPVLVDNVFARNDLSDGNVQVKVEMDSGAATKTNLRVQIMPENCDGQTYKKTVEVDLPAGASVETLTIPMPNAKAWSPDAPNLYRCRVTVQNDVKDVLFGCRSFSIVSKKNPKPGLPSGMFMLNGKPCYLRGTNIQGLNVYAYWGQTDKLINAVMLLKAANFNVVRVCQHVQMPEVRQMLDRLGMMSEQDQGGGHRRSLPYGIRREQHIHTGTVLARETYNNPGVVLLTFGNEHEFATEPIVRAVLAVDPQRIVKPISGRFSHSRKAWDLPQDLRANAIDDGHPYSGWYRRIKPQTWNYDSPLKGNVGGDGRMVMLGEFGGEALDSYETMKTYPPQFAPPPPDTDTLWASSQVRKHDKRQIIGLGLDRKPTNLAEYIEASQNYQAALLADKVIPMRLLPRDVAGYFQFHFIDVVPVFWPKSIVSHDQRPKKAYYQMAQVNQPTVALPQLSGNRPDAMTIWVANDLPTTFNSSTVRWAISRDGKTLLEGEQAVDVPATNIAKVRIVDLKPVTWKYPNCDLQLTLIGENGKVVSLYQRQLRCTPKQLLKKAIRDQIEDPFNDKKK